MEPDLVGTLQWQRLRKLLLDALQEKSLLDKHDIDPAEVAKLLGFLGEHWNCQVPRQTEFATFEQTLRGEIRGLQRRLAHEVDLREQIANTMRYDRPVIDEVD